MSIFNDSLTGFPVGDPSVSPFPASYEFSRKRIDLSPLILSASGWRKVFASDGGEESCVSTISLEDKERLVLIGTVLSEFFKRRTERSDPLIVVGIDSRYTGPGIADILIRTFLVHGLQVRYLFITAAPEIMALTRISDSIDGFAYVSASHNPVGHNGLKFGLSSGGVIGGTEADTLIRELRSAAETAQGVASTIEQILQLSPAVVEEVYTGITAAKQEALAAYAHFAKHIVSGYPASEEQNEALSSIREGVKRYPIGVVAELNGSARGVSIDREFISGFGIKLKVENGIPRQIVHRIVPEGESLDECSSLLEELHRESSEFVFGYVPDNDGDRGNLVYVGRNGKPRILEAQEVFALVCLAELGWLFYTSRVHQREDSRLDEKVAVAVNGPTSLRIERIAEAFDAKVFRAEVGEANVVSLAEALRHRGYIVRILGEGSNGGNITNPSSVRDPLATVFSIVKLLTIRSSEERKGLFELWCERSGRQAMYRADYTLDDIIATLPAFTTTSAFEDRARLDIRTQDHLLLKKNYEAVFVAEWDRKREELERKFGIHFWEEIIYEGTTEEHGQGKFTPEREGRGGFKILFKDAGGRPLAFIWMRGSGTEAVFRILADVEGDDPAAEEYLLSWHRDMIRKADTLSG